VVLTASVSPAAAANALECGAVGVVGKSRPTSDLIEAIVAAGAGERWVDPDLDPGDLAGMDDDRKRLAHLTPREFDILLRLARGQRLNDIAADLFISPKTVSTHRRRLLDKLELRANVDLTRLALDLGLLD
jgi:DNA-binding NarL/FixJ family response regulator